MSERISLLVALPVGSAAWAGLAYLILTQPPSDLAIAVALPLLGIAAANSAVPVLLWLHRRRQRLRYAIRTTTVWRQALWVGLFAALCGVLQLARILDPLLIAMLVVALSLLEAFWQRRE